MEGVHDVVIDEVAQKPTKNGDVYFHITYMNGTKKTSQLVFPPREGQKYDPSQRGNRITQQLFAHVFGLDMDPDGEEFADNLATGYALLESANLKGLHAKVQLGYNGIHAKYVRGEKTSYILATRSGEPMRGYEDKKFDSRGAVEAELKSLNLQRPPDKQFRFHSFVEIQEYLEPKESNTAKLAKYLKPDQEIEVDDAESF